MVPGGVRSWGMSDTEQQQSWFHAIDLGQGRVTAGRFDPATPPNYTLFGFFDLIRHIDLSRACCFDIGTMDGLSAFVLAGLGARRVVACDLADRETFRWARAQLGYDRIEYRTPVSAHDLPQHVGDERADLIVMAGVLYHVHDPLSVLVSLRQSLRREGLLIVETIFQPNEPSPQMVFNPCDTSAGHIPHTNVYWRPSKAALHGMLELSGFEVMATPHRQREAHGLGPRPPSARSRLSLPLDSPGSPAAPSPALPKGRRLRRNAARFGTGGPSALRWPSRRTLALSRVLRADGAAPAAVAGPQRICSFVGCGAQRTTLREAPRGGNATGPFLRACNAPWARHHGCQDCLSRAGDVKALT
jgi:2-polyprenyl-3-methyl-5-hydroxy-6-metoxy-1,4-benzoquinol methylase